MDREELLYCAKLLYEDNLIDDCILKDIQKKLEDPLVCEWCDNLVEELFSHLDGDNEVEICEECLNKFKLGVFDDCN